MAGIGLYGVFYRNGVKVNGVLTGYEGPVRMMGKAIAANFAANTVDDNPLEANNGVAENDISTGSGGTLTMTLDRMTLETAADLYGTTVEEVEVEVDGQKVHGVEIGYKGNEVSAPVGVAYIQMHQEDGVRNHRVVFYRECVLDRPSDEARTMGRNSLEWQTPEITGTVEGLQGDGSNLWYRKSQWPTQQAAIAYIYKLFGTSVDEQQAAQANDLNGENEVGV